MKKLFKCVGNGHDKFWQVETDGVNYEVRWGANGTAGTVQTKVFLSEHGCENFAYQKINEKLAKGYVEFTVGGYTATLGNPQPAFKPTVAQGTPVQVIGVDLEAAQKRAFEDTFEECILEY